MVLISMWRHLSQVRKDLHWFGSKGSPIRTVGHVPCPPPCNPPTTIRWPRLASPRSGFDITRHLGQSTFLSGPCVATDFPMLNFDVKNTLGGRWMVSSQFGQGWIIRSWLNTFEALEQMRKDDQLLMHKGYVGGRLKLLWLNPLFFKSNYLCSLLGILWCFRTSFKVEKYLILSITTHVLCFQDCLFIGVSVKITATTCHCGKSPSGNQ